MKWKRIVLVIALVAALSVALGFSWPYFWRLRNGNGTLRLPGVVEIQEVRLGSKVGGRVAEVKVLEGDLVKKDEVLVILEAPELQTQRKQWEAKLVQAQLELKKAVDGPRPEEIESARGAYDAAKARLKRVESGWREEEKRQALADWEGAEADMKLAWRELQRTRESDIAASRSDYDTKNTVYQSAKARAASAKARLDMLNKGSREEDIAEAQQELKRLEYNFKLLEIGTREEDKDLARSRVVEIQAKLDELDANLNEAEIRAPGPAIVDVMAVRKGDLVAPNQQFIRILRAEDMWVKVYVPEPELGKVRRNQLAEITIDSYPGKVFHGAVLYVSSESEFTPRNVQSPDERRHQVFAIRIRVSDPQGIFKSGMAAEVSLRVE